MTAPPVPGGIRCVKGEARLDEKQEPQVIALLNELVKQLSDYDPPRLRKDGDIVIPLDAVLKKNRAAHQNFAEAFSEMMRDDLGPKRSSTWVK